MKSIDKLREWLDYKVNRFIPLTNTIVLNTGANPDELYEIADEIEAEIADRYMLLPVDADGVPIHPGDLIIDKEGRKFEVVMPYRLVDKPMHYRHVKPRTLEDVLRDVWKEALDYAKSDMWRNPDEVFAERADEILELLGFEIDEPDTIRNELLGGDAE